MTKNIQIAIVGVFCTLAYLFLIGYAVLLYFLDFKSKAGIVVASSVVLMDAFNFLLYMSSMVKTPSQIIFLLILNRVLMVILGQDKFIYGFMILYLLYALAFVFQMARNRFPLEGDIVLKSAKIDRLINLKRAKGMNK